MFDHKCSFLPEIENASCGWCVHCFLRYLYDATTFTHISRCTHAHINISIPLQIIRYINNSFFFSLFFTYRTCIRIRWFCSAVLFIFLELWCTVYTLCIVSDTKIQDTKTKYMYVVLGVASFFCMLACKRVLYVCSYSLVYYSLPFSAFSILFIFQPMSCWLIQLSLRFRWIYYAARFMSL